ncbi:hypothetical protein Hanom_Chr06g00567921 [Helianthus anomalus]
MDEIQGRLICAIYFDDPTCIIWCGEKSYYLLNLPKMLISSFATRQHFQDQ